MNGPLRKRILLVEDDIDLLRISRSAFAAKIL